MSIRYKIITGILLATVVAAGGCMLGHFVSGDLYYYSLIAPEDGAEESHTLIYKSGGYTIVMSRGIHGEKLTKEEAEDLKNTTSFTLMLDDEAVAGRDIGVDELGFMKRDGWHVVEYFDLPPLARGTVRTLTGTSHFGEGQSITNTVYLTIK